MIAEELERHIKSGQTSLILDVRSALEFNSGHIPAAIHAPVVNILKTVQSVCTNKDELLVLVCEHGPRAQLAKVLLKWNGYKNLELLDGHMSQWRSSGRSMEKRQN